MFEADRKIARFEGNCPRNVARDAKYSVRREGGKYVVGLLYRATFREEWRPVNKEHPALVEMVNSVKVQHGTSAGGPFYINEYKQVIVPVSGTRDYYLAGEYTEPLEFEFEGQILSGNAIDLQGRPLQPGDMWVGPHPGIPYTLKAGAQDIIYRTEPRPRVTKEVWLSDYQDKVTVNQICTMVARVKGLEGGRFYINEFQQLFAPRNGENGVQYVYIGRLDTLEQWFPKPNQHG